MRRSYWSTLGIAYVLANWLLHQLQIVLAKLLMVLLLLLMLL